jgi:hypothetical protein
MKNKFFLLICLAFLCICFMLSTSAFAAAHWETEKIKNWSTRTMISLEKTAVGDIPVITWDSDKFGAFNSAYNAGQNATTFTWASGNVISGQSAWVGYKTDSTRILYKYMPKWIYAKGDTVAGPALSAGFDEYPKAGKIDLIISNTAEDGDTLTIDTIQVGVVRSLFLINKLVYDSLGSVSWIVTKTSFSLPLTGSQIFEVPNVPKNGGVVYRAKIHLKKNPSNIVECVGQYAEERQTPTLTQWGLIILVGLIVASGVFIMLRRRRAVPA